MPNSEKIPAWFRYPKYNWQNKHAVIIGAGIAGCQTAWHLSQQGWQVTLIERHRKIATEASGNPAGVISPKMTASQSAGEDFYVDCFHYALEQLNALHQQGLECDWHPCGLLQLAHNEREEKRWQALKDRGFSNDFLQLLNQENTSKKANISLNYKASYFTNAGWVNPVNLCKALTTSDNCNTLLDSEAISLDKQQNLWHVLDNQGITIAQAEVVIIANGKDLNALCSTEYLPTQRVAGQTTCASASTLSKQLKTVISHEGYLTPASSNSNQHTFGATFERHISDAVISSQADNENLKQLQRYLPEFTASLEKIESAHAAVRMTTPDRFPYIGALADIDFYERHYHDLHQGKQWKKYPEASYQTGLFMLGGLGSRGLTTSGLCAKSLADLLQDNSITKQQEKLLQHCHPARYLVKKLKTSN